MTRPRKKELGLVIFTLFISVLLFWWLTISISGAPHPYIVVALLATSLMWVALTVLALTLATSNISRAVLVLGIPLIVVVLGQAHIGALGAALLLVLPLANAQRHLIHEVQNRIKYRPAQIFSAGTRLVLLGLIIAVAGLSITPLSENLSRNGFQIPKQLIELALKPAEGTIRGILPGYTADRTIDQLIEAKLQTDASLPPGTSLPPEQLAALHRDLTERFGLPISGRETLPALVTTYINQKLSVLTQNSPLLTALLALTAFLLLARLIVPILLWPALATVALFVYLAQRAGFVYLLISPETVERLQL